MPDVYPKWPTKDPDEKLDYAVNWASWLDVGDTIVSAQWELPSGLTEESSFVSPDGKKTVIWISGGNSVYSQPGALCKVKVNTAGGRIGVKTIALPIGPHP